MNKTPEQILQEVSTTNPHDLYIKGVKFLEKNGALKCKSTGNLTNLTKEAWGITKVRKIEGSQLFRYTGSEKGDVGVDRSCGCLTQVKSGDYSSYYWQVTEAIREDNLIPATILNSDTLTERQLYRFAQWQTWLDENIPDRMNVEDFYKYFFG